MGCVEHPVEEDLYADMVWKISEKTGTIQLSKLIPLDVLYQQEHSSGVIGRIWHDHHQAFANFVNEFSPDSIFEIGGLHGILAEKYHNSFDNIPWNILEPNPIPTENSKAKFEKGFFSSSYKPKFNFDTVIHSHVWEHIYEPLEFLKNISNIMLHNEKLIFSVPNMKEMLRRNYTNCLNFEHTIFLTEELIEFMLSNHGFEVLKKDYFLHDHSIFYSTKKSDVKKTLLFDNHFSENKNLFNDFLNYHINLIRDLNNKIKNTSSPVYLFGAHVFSQYLIQEGLNTRKIKYILDNDNNKHYKRLYGSSLEVRPPKVLLNDEKPLIILKAGVYNDEIRSDILENINSSAVFLE